MNFFVFLFALACIATLVFGAKKEWRDARIVSAVVAIVAFAMALVSASLVKR
ncbi:MAG: hypothetical protein JO101_03055 [Candidatus Eremiobacteraeota bacterium]|nr:hypothetical protein [Candidatus Eremiobacteraeota bacterium]MBV8354271.1 hypothetical protein [Candidatus Eremiobacteraeota bacterium]